MAQEFVTVATDAAVAENSITRIEINGQPVVLSRIGGKLCAIGGICTHEQAELAEGDIEGGIIYCPLHGSGFEMLTGKVHNGPAADPVAAYDVKSVDGKVQVSTTPS
jgi:3-phenylpropionate/trans-cinnamate dioxygenase ferredoxin subunit